MLKTCEQCGTQYLSEADPHAYVWRGKLWEDNCGCFFTQSLRTRLASAEEALIDYAARPDSHDNYCARAHFEKFKESEK